MTEIKMTMEQFDRIRKVLDEAYDALDLIVNTDCYAGEYWSEGDDACNHLRDVREDVIIEVEDKNGLL